MGGYPALVASIKREHAQYITDHACAQLRWLNRTSERLQAHRVPPQIRPLNRRPCGLRLGPAAILHNRHKREDRLSNQSDDNPAPPILCFQGRPAMCFSIVLQLPQTVGDYSLGSN